MLTRFKSPEQRDEDLTCEMGPFKSLRVDRDALIADGDTVIAHLWKSYNQTLVWRLTTNAGVGQEDLLAWWREFEIIS